MERVYAEGLTTLLATGKLTYVRILYVYTMCVCILQWQYYHLICHVRVYQTVCFTSVYTTINLHRYMSTPIAITVEGANILTRSMITFGQV